MGFRDRLLGAVTRAVDTARAVARAVRDPSSYAPPPLPTEPPQRREPERPRARPAPRREREVSRPPAERRSRPVSRGELPESWGSNKAALWIDATTTEPALARDEYAQMFYDAALYTHSESRDQRELNLANFKAYIFDEYGVEWDHIFDWESYREDYDLIMG